MILTLTSTDDQGRHIQIVADNVKEIEVVTEIETGKILSTRSIAADLAAAAAAQAAGVARETQDAVDSARAAKASDVFAQALDKLLASPSTSPEFKDFAAAISVVVSDVPTTDAAQVVVDDAVVVDTPIVAP